jgi:hypothetical protein
MTLKDVINCAYMHVDAGDYENMRTELSRYVGSDRFNAFRAGIQHVYGMDIYPLDAGLLEQLDEAVTQAYENGKHTGAVLQDVMHVASVILDVPPKIWYAWKDPLFNTTIRIDEIIFPFAHNYARGDYGVSTVTTQMDEYRRENCMDLDSLEDFDDALEKYVASLQDDAACIKIGTAYSRGLDFRVEENRDGTIGSIYQKTRQPGARLSATEAMRWSNYVVTFLLSYALAERLPVQVHTGLATMEGTSPLAMIPIMKSFPDVQFYLFHGGYPFHDILPGVLDACKNAHVDLCWMPILSQHATRSLLKELISMGHAERVIAFGGDCVSVEGSAGALALTKQIVSSVLGDIVDQGSITGGDAIDLANTLLFENGRRSFPKRFLP